jgi:hypothetical protein
MWWLLIFVVILAVSIGFAYWSGGLVYVINPEPFISDINGKNIYIFLSVCIFLFMMAVVLSWLAAYIILGLTREKSNDRMRIGIEAGVNLSWAWGFLVTGFLMVFFIAFVIFYFGVAASNWWEAILAFSPHIAVFLGLLCLSLAKARQTS